LLFVEEWRRIGLRETEKSVRRCISLFSSSPPRPPTFCFYFANFSFSGDYKSTRYFINFCLWAVLQVARQRVSARWTRFQIDFSCSLCRFVPSCPFWSWVSTRNWMLNSMYLTHRSLYHLSIHLLYQFLTNSKSG
jgi:hypothetical protein